MKIRIVSGGTDATTTITDAETGEAIDLVRSYQIRHELDDITRAKIEVVMPEVDVVADATITAVCPFCGHEEKEHQP